MDATRFGRFDSYLGVHAAAWHTAIGPHLAAVLVLGPRAGDRPSRKEDAHACAASFMAVLLADAVATRAAYMPWEARGLAALGVVTKIKADQRDAPDLTATSQQGEAVGPSHAGRR